MRERQQLVELHNKLTHPVVRRLAKEGPKSDALFSGIVATLEWVMYPDRVNKPTELLVESVDNLIAAHNSRN